MTGPLFELQAWIRNDGRSVLSEMSDNRNDQAMSSPIEEKLAERSKKAEAVVRPLNGTEHNCLIFITLKKCLTEGL